MRSTLLGVKPEAKYWTRYAEIYAALAQHAPGQFPQLFAEVFANAYDREAVSKTNTFKTATISSKTG
jgi:predicted component of type VI protein secretion system